VRERRLPPSNCTTTGTVTTCVFAYTGAAQKWTVPAGVTQATFDVYGATGGTAAISNTPGGAGGGVTATLPVSAGSTYQLVVGGAGTDNGRAPSERAGAGLNGGGAGGNDGGSGEGDGGGGGGASDVRSGSCAATLACGLEARILVGGGGGGGGAWLTPGGGNAGNPTGAPGGGSGGGGGGGYYGGGGGASSGTQGLGGGGGGSSFGPANATFSENPPGLTNGQITITFCPSTAGVTTCTFASTGVEQSFTVPAGVSSVHVVASGATGGSGSSTGPGGRGAVVSANLTVTPGDVLYVEVGGAPTTTTTADCFEDTPCVGGFNGGGSSRFGGGGGGGSDVRTISRGDAGTLASRLLVAAGGGGGGGLYGGGGGGATTFNPDNGFQGGAGGGGGGSNLVPAGGKSALTTDPPQITISYTQPAKTVSIAIAGRKSLQGHSVASVAVLSTSDFDARSIDPKTVCFGDAEDPTQRD
jgi:hypothetical protein